MSIFVLSATFKSSNNWRPRGASKQNHQAFAPLRFAGGGSHLACLRQFFSIRHAGSDQSEVAQACSDRTPGLALPLDRIAQEVQPDGRQGAALDNLADASARASEMLKSNCQTATALTPTGRIEAMRQRIGTMLNAVVMVRPALDAFYGSLSYEQRARFNMIGGQEG